MNLALRTVLTVLIVGQAGTALAAISAGSQNAGQPEGELFLAVWDPVNQISYTRDLGVDVLATDFSSTPLSFAADSLFTTTFAASNSTDLRYSIVGVNNDLVNAAVLGVWTTSNSDVVDITLNEFAALSTMHQNIFDYTIGVNEAAGSSDLGVDLSSVIFDTTSPGYYGNEFTFDETLGSIASFTTGAAVGEAIAFYSLVISNETGGQLAVNQFADGANPFVWTLGLDGDLSYAPVPIPAAVWLFGSALLAFRGLRRSAS